MWKQAAKKYFLIIIGTISLILGMVGVVLPVLPTTPFLILAAFCYLRSSNRLYLWLIGHKILGPYIYNYMMYRAVAKKTKIVTMILLWATLLVSILVVDNLHIRLLLLVIGLAVSIHIATLKTLQTRNSHMPCVCQGDRVADNFEKQLNYNSGDCNRPYENASTRK